MLEFIKAPEDVLALKYTGAITGKELDAALDKLEAMLAKPGKIHFYIEMRGIEGIEANYVWHKETSLGEADAIVLPGGFSYGDYLRCGAIARFSPIMRAVSEAARAGKLIIGTCNGFQILCEAGLLPGALVRNRSRADPVEVLQPSRQYRLAVTVLRHALHDGPQPVPHFDRAQIASTGHAFADAAHRRLPVASNQAEDIAQHN